MKTIDIKEIEFVSAPKRFYYTLKNGLLLFGIRNRLERIGINIQPYYWVLEEVERCKEPLIKDYNSEKFQCVILTDEEVKLIAKNVPTLLGKEIHNSLKKGQTFIALKYDQTIAAYMCIELNDFTFNNKEFQLKKNEAYLLNMWTFHSFRGKNIAPYLRFQSYRYLENMGIDVKYSITNYFNKSSIKFKNKLNSKHLKLYLSIVLLKKFYWNFVLKNFNKT